MTLWIALGLVLTGIVAGFAVPLYGMLRRFWGPLWRRGNGSNRGG